MPSEGDKKKKGVLNRVRRLLRKHQQLLKVIEIAQYATSFGSMFVKGDSSLYDVVVEGLHGLTNMIAFLKTFTNSHDPDTLNKCSTILHCIMLIISHFEVFLEKLSSCYCDDINTSIKDNMIFLVESIKTTYRLYLLFLKEQNSVMMIQWGQGFNAEMKFTYSLEDYRVFLDPTISPSSSVDGDKYFKMDGWEVDMSAMHGSRYPPQQEDGLDQEESKDKASQKEDPLSYLHDNQHSVTDNKDIFGQAQRFIGFGLNSDQLLLLGETLYVLRPAVYSFLVSRLNKREAEKPFHQQQVRRKSHLLLALAVSMVMEVLSILCSSKALAMVERDCPPARSYNERSVNQQQHPMMTELKRRKTALLLNLLRSPLLDRATLPLLRKVTDILRFLPIIGALPPRILNALEYLSSIYFYTSNS